MRMSLKSNFNKFRLLQWEIIAKRKESYLWEKPKVFLFLDQERHQDKDRARIRSSTSISIISITILMSFITIFIARVDKIARSANKLK
jgi:hypothetical protein